MAFNFNKGGRLGKYFYLDEKGVDYGPFEISDLLERITKDTLVYYQGVNWTKASELAELKRYFPVEQKAVKKVVEKSQLVAPTKSKNYTLPVLFILLLFVGVIAFFLFLESMNSKEFEQELASLQQKQKADSLASVNSKLILELQNDSINDAYNTKLDSISSYEKRFLFLQNEEFLAQKIQDYYSQIENNNFDAYNYFSESVDQFINLKGITPNEINEVFTGDRDYKDEQTYFDFNTFKFERELNNIFYFTYSIHYSCFRVKRNKTQNCDVDLEVGFDENFQIKSYKELKIRNLKFE